jgi:low affinity Fe/Cu permease
MKVLSMPTATRRAVRFEPELPKPKHDLFTRVAGWTIRATGGRWGFLTALGTVVVWGAMGPFCGYSENWQLVINTGTTIVTFLMVFLIQNAQNRESKATHLKLDELILAVNRARNELIDIEQLTEEQLDLLAERYHKVAELHRHKLNEYLQVEKPRATNGEGHITVK